MTELRCHPTKGKAVPLYLIYFHSQKIKGYGDYDRDVICIISQCEKALTSASELDLNSHIPPLLPTCHGDGQGTFFRPQFPHV